MEKTFSIDFKIFGKEDRGIYYHETNRAVVYLNNHESLPDIYKTIQHEVIHHCLRDYEEIDEGQEELLIFNMAWAEYSLA